MAKKKLLDEEIDYSDRIMTQISRGAPVEEVADTLGQRMDKIGNDPNLSKYANDRYTQAAMDYIKQGGQNQPFTYEAAPTYASKYATQIDSLMNDIFGSTYDGWKQGTEYGALENRYKGLGQNAMQDTLAQVSARTGGMASSYAGAAAQGAYNEYMKQLDEAAYNRYLAERGELVDLMQMQMNADNIEYGKTLDRIAAERDAEATAYERSMAEDSISYERQMLEREQAMETVNNMIAMGATLADIPADLLAKSGYGESYVNVGNADYKRQTAPKPAAGASGAVAAEPIEEEPGYEPYTRKQYDTYTQIATNLAKKAESDENYEPLNYIRMVEKSMGSDYYKNLIGNTLYERLINEMDEYSFGNRQEPEDNYLGAIYNAMMSAEDPEQWLTENAQYLTEDELATALKWLE